MLTEVKNRGVVGVLMLVFTAPAIGDIVLFGHPAPGGQSLQVI